MSDRVRVTVWVSGFELERLDEIAARQRLTRSGALREAITWLAAKNARYQLVSERRRAEQQRQERDERRAHRERRERERRERL